MLQSKTVSAYSLFVLLPFVPSSSFISYRQNPYYYHSTTLSYYGYYSSSLVSSRSLYWLDIFLLFIASSLGIILYSWLLLLLVNTLWLVVLAVLFDLNELLIGCKIHPFDIILLFLFVTHSLFITIIIRLSSNQS